MPQAAVGTSRGQLASSESPPACPHSFTLLPTLRRAIPVTGCERLRRNNSKLFLFFYDKKDGTRMPLELHERQQRLNPPRSDGIPTTVVHQTRWRLPALFTNKARKLAAIDTAKRAKEEEGQRRAFSPIFAAW